MALLDKMLCYFKLCKACVPKSDDTGCWGECLSCGAKYGFVEREVLRKYCDKDVEKMIGQASDRGEDG